MIIIRAFFHISLDIKRYVCTQHFSFSFIDIYIYKGINWIFLSWRDHELRKFSKCRRHLFKLERDDKLYRHEANINQNTCSFNESLVKNNQATASYLIPVYTHLYILVFEINEIRNGGIKKTLEADKKYI